MKLQNKKGFTLIELLVVITIIGILAAWAVVTYTSQIQKGRDTVRISDVQALQSGIEQYYWDKSEYPTSNTAWFGTGWVGVYIELLPKDGKTWQTCWGNTPCDYLYSVKADANGITNWNYNVSSWFENKWNLDWKATKDGWKMDTRYEVWVWISWFTWFAWSWSITNTWSCLNTTTWDINYMVIKWSC